MEFNKDTTIGEILEKAPEKAEILLEIGMHCLGCPASQMETLEEACDVHGIDVEEVIKKFESNIKHDTLADNIIYNEPNKEYTDTNINGENLKICVEVL